MIRTMMGALILLLVCVLLLAVLLLRRNAALHAQLRGASSPQRSFLPANACWLALPLLVILVWPLWIVLNDFLDDRGSRWVMRAAIFEWIAPLTTLTLLVVGMSCLLLRYPSIRLHLESFKGLSPGQAARHLGDYLPSGFGLVGMAGLLLWLILNGLVATLACCFPAGSGHGRADRAFRQRRQTPVRAVALAKGVGGADTHPDRREGSSWADALGLNSVLRVNGFCDLANLTAGTRLTLTGRPSPLGFAIDRIDSIQAGDHWCLR